MSAIWLLKFRGTPGEREARVDIAATGFELSQISADRLLALDFRGYE
jgi:hypothetical protein